MKHCCFSAKQIEIPNCPKPAWLYAIMDSTVALALTTAIPTTETSSAANSVPKFLQEDQELSEERRELLSSLPKERGWVLTQLHQYQGFWLTTRHLLGVLNCQENFQAQDSDILLVTNPKSGTTWLKALTFALMNRTRYAAADDDDDPQQQQQKHPLLTNNPHELVPFLELKLFVDDQVPDLTDVPPPRLFATHLPFVSLPTSVKEEEYSASCKLVYLCRNPKDTFVSLWHFTNRLRPKENGTNSLEEAFDKFCRGVCLCGPYWDHVLGYWKASLENPDRVMFLQYDQMKEQPSLHLKRLAEFLGCPFSQEEETNGLVDRILKLCSFENLSNLEVNKNGKMPSGEEYKVFFRRGEVGDWMNHLTKEMIERLDQITQHEFHGSGLKF